jgi:hypothetical protein
MIFHLWLLVKKGKKERETEIEARREEEWV